MSTITAISSASLQESYPATSLTSKLGQAANASATSTTSSANTLTQDSVTLIGPNTSGATSDLAQLKADTSAQQASSDSSSFGIPGHLVKGMTGLLQDLSAGDTSAAKTDGAQLQKDLQAQGTASSSVSQASGNLVDASA
jgi:hypothetical protein